MQRIGIHRHRVRRERPWHEVLPPGPRDPDVVGAKALARAGGRAGGRTARLSRSPRPAEMAGFVPDFESKAKNLTAALADGRRRAVQGVARAV